MGTPQLATTWDREQVLALPEDGQRHELVDGALLVSPAPAWRHQDAVAALYRRLHEWLTPRRLGVARFAPADLAFDGAHLLQPDVFVAPLVDGRRRRAWAEVRTPLLVIEVLSPSTPRHDRPVKRSFYQRHGVPEYWTWTSTLGWSSGGGLATPVPRSSSTGWSGSPAPPRNRWRD